LGANENDLTENLIEQEFIWGISNESRQRTIEENSILSNLTQIMKEFYQTTNSQMFVKASTQNCSDLIVNVGECCIWKRMYEKFLEGTPVVFNASLINKFFKVLLFHILQSLSFLPSVYLLNLFGFLTLQQLLIEPYVNLTFFT
jgi:hypothetical protein